MKTNGRFHQSGKATIWTVVAAVCVVMLGLALVLPGLASLRRSQRIHYSVVPQRGIQGAMILFSQGNNGFYPGFNGRDLTHFSTPIGWSQGATNGRDVSQRFAILLLDYYFTGEYIISSNEAKTIWTWGTVTAANYSYALLELPNIQAEPAGAAQNTELPGRLKEWSNTINKLAPVVTDRSKVLDPTLKTASVYVKGTKPSDWQGAVVWNDNHVTFERSPILPATRYGQTDNTSDDLFTAKGDADAFMSYGK